MKTNIILSVALALTATTATARSWRINNDTRQQADFTSINAAMSSEDVQAGDTLYLDPNCALTNAQTVTKQVTIVGPGYFRADQPHLFASIYQVNLNAAGIKMEGVIVTDATTVNANDVTIERCKLVGVTHGKGSYTNTTIRQCYISGYVSGYSDRNTTYDTRYTTVENCIIIRDNARVINNLSYPTIRNNYIVQSGTGKNQNFYCISHGTITNNIIRNAISTKEVGYITGYVSDTQISNNVILFESAHSSYPDNLYGYTTEAEIFALEGTNDQRYQLKEDSPARGYAADGGDCGPFGGLYPYVINGLPKGYPYYTKAQVTSTPKDGTISVSLQIKQQDE